jgi:hypothetical protein
MAKVSSKGGKGIDRRRKKDSSNENERKGLVSR